MIGHTVLKAGAFALVGAGAWMGLATTAAADVTLYQHCGYKGYSVTLKDGDYSLSRLVARGVKNDDISSVRVTGGSIVTLYEDAGYRGDQRVIRSSTSCLSGFNDEVSSVRVVTRTAAATRPTVTLYEDCGYRGRSVTVGAGRYSLTALMAKGMKNDDVSSIRVSPGAQALLFEHSRQRGRMVDLTSDTSCLVGLDFNDTLSSLMVTSNDFVMERNTQCVNNDFGTGIVANVSWYRPETIEFNAQKKEFVTTADAIQEDSIAVFRSSCLTSDSRMVAIVRVAGGKYATGAVSVAAGTLVSVGGAVACIGTAGAACPAVAVGLSVAVGAGSSFGVPDAEEVFYVGAPRDLKIGGTVWTPFATERKPWRG